MQFMLRHSIGIKHKLDVRYLLKKLLDRFDVAAEQPTVANP